MTDDRKFVASKIEIVKDATVIVHWEDGHVGEYPAPYLRAKCPCAGCREEVQPGSHAPLSVGSLLPMMPQKARPGVTIRDIVPVGYYAVRIVFSDEHDSGIYSFTYLRETCPCGECGGGKT